VSAPEFYYFVPGVSIESSVSTASDSERIKETVISSGSN